MNLYDINGNVISNGTSENVMPEDTSFFEETTTKEPFLTPYEIALNEITWGEYFKGSNTNSTTTNSSFTGTVGTTGYIPVSGLVIATLCLHTGISTSYYCYDSNKNYLGYVASSYEQVNSKDTTYYRIGRLLENTSYIRFNISYTQTDKNLYVVSSTKYLIKEEYLPTTDFNVLKWNGKKVIVDGDSITNAGTWHTWLKEWFGWDTVYNHAGSGMSLTNARSGNDASGVGSGLKGYERVQQNYETDADAIILMGDGNDSSAWTDEATGVYTDTTEDTWCGRMNLMLNALVEKYPLKPIVLISNPPRNGEERNGLGNAFDRQAKAMKDLAYNKGFYYIDCYHTSIFRPDNTTNAEAFSNSGDGVHLNDLCSKLEAQMIFEELKKVGFDF